MSGPRPEGQGERLQKILARAGVASRRAAEEMIAAGRVRVNGVVVTRMGMLADSHSDKIEVDGKPLKPLAAETGPDEFVYVIVNKPAGVVSTVRDPQGRKTVLDLLPAERFAGKGIRLFPVGRLDADTTGLLLLTNDGDLTFRLTHPKYGIEKEYRARVRGRPSGADLERLRTGIDIEGERTAPAIVEARGAEGSDVVLNVVINEGKKRQVRLMMAAVGHPVVELERVRFGPITLGTLEHGRWRYLATHEVHELRKAVKLPARSTRGLKAHAPASAPGKPRDSRPGGGEKRPTGSRAAPKVKR